MDFIINNVDNFFSIATQIIGVFAVIASMTPNEVDNQILDKVAKLINVFGFNFGKAKNE
tara:strand:+ start:111 stop:287 length:177 start_codon:yes stop_codon:yes gene_type:complete